MIESYYTQQLSVYLVLGGLLQDAYRERDADQVVSLFHVVGDLVNEIDAIEEHNNLSYDYSHLLE